MHDSPSNCTATHAPALQIEEALASAQAVPQAPQFLASVSVLTSQPLAAFLSQSAKPALHEVVHVPLVHASPWFGPAVQTLPQAPQLRSSVVVLTSQPLAAPRSQSRKPRLHDPMPHMPPAHPALALGSARQLFPHRPQLWVSELVSMQAPSQHSTPLPGAPQRASSAQPGAQ